MFLNSEFRNAEYWGDFKENWKKRKKNVVVISVCVCVFRTTCVKSTHIAGVLINFLNNAAFHAVLSRSPIKSWKKMKQTEKNLVQIKCNYLLCLMRTLSSTSNEHHIIMELIVLLDVLRWFDFCFGICISIEFHAIRYTSTFNSPVFE